MLNSQIIEEEPKNEQWNTLNRKKHIDKLIEGLTGQLPDVFERLVPAQTWTVYWITHSLALLEQPQFLNSVTEDVIGFIKECAHGDGGYGGGPGQIAHLATTFASVNALITTSNERALESIDRISLVRFLHRMKQENGSFTMHDDGEIDSRATYCALAILRCLNIEDVILMENVADWLLSCQTYEGGFGSVPGSEAHGGYTFCCVASLCLLNQLQRADLTGLLRWLTNKQLNNDHGFCGRSNKLVDSCYSYWQGAVFPLIHPFLKVPRNNNSASRDHSPSTSDQIDERGARMNKNCSKRASSARNDRETRPSGRKSTDTTMEYLSDQILDHWMFDCMSLQDYVLNHCQSKTGLLRDKPGATPDFYHTCYALSGLSISQHQPDGSLFDMGSNPINILDSTHPLFNLTFGNLNYCFDYFANKKIETLKSDISSNKSSL